MLEGDRLLQCTRTTCAVVLAGGAGTRIRHLHPDVPKPMVTVAGAPFIDWVLRYLNGQGVRRFIISLGHLADVVERHLVQRRADGCQIVTAREKQPLGTGGAFRFACQSLDGDIETLVLTNGDSLVFAELAPAFELLEDDAVDGVVMGLTVSDASRYGRLDVADDGRLLRFSEKQPGAGLINAGVYIFRRRVLACFPSQFPLSMEHDVFPSLISQGARLMVHRCQAPFIDIGTPESLARADSFVRRYFARQVAA